MDAMWPAQAIDGSANVIIAAIKPGLAARS